MWGWIRLKQLRRNRGYVLILAFVVSALMNWHRTPPDATSMAIMAVSMYLVFEAGLFLARLFVER